MPTQLEREKLRQPMPAVAGITGFLSDLDRAVKLSDVEKKVLGAANINSPEMLYALALNFPSIADVGVDLAKLTNAAAQRVPQLFAIKANDALVSPPPVFGRGAIAPKNAKVTEGFQVPMPKKVPSAKKKGPLTPPPKGNPMAGVTSGGPSGAGASGYWDDPSWPVRDQGARGTCVAHAVVALNEWVNGMPLGDLSEQFLFWAAKTQSSDPHPSVDGTRADYATQALAKMGLCNESFWNYNPRIGATVHQGPPTAGVIAQAARHKRSRRRYSPGGNSKTLRNWLKVGPVAISVPVFVNAATPGRHNWNSLVGIEYGVVLDPVPTSVVNGGHAVCVVGFAADATESAGGYFILRNSWSTAWGRSNPSAQGSSRWAHRTGYGQISASHIDGYLWEMAQL